jgi:hypothetical protein
MRQAYEHAARMLAAQSYALYSALLCGNPSPNQRRQFEWMRKPHLGCMVFIDAARHTTAPEKTVGRWTAMWTYLLPDCDDEDLPFRDRETYGVYEIELLDGSICSWSNVSLLRIPASIKEWAEITPIVKATDFKE